MTKVIVADIINELKKLNKARSPSGKAPVCNTVIAGSNPARASRKALENISSAFFILWFTHREFYGILFTIVVGRGKQKNRGLDHIRTVRFLKFNNIVERNEIYEGIRR